MSRKLLLADDSITIQKVVELVLSEEDFHIKAVSNGNDALSQVEVFNPDVVLADIEMPGMNGYQLCDKIKKNRATAHISVLLLAGAFEPLDEELAKNVGADDYIVKPFESQELISKINAVLTVSGTVIEAAVAEAPGEAEEVHQIAQETVAEVEALETVEVAESAGAAEEDLWAMDEAEPLESNTADVWEIDEGEAVSAESVDIGMAEMDMATGIEEVQAVEEVVALADEPALAAAEPEPVIAEPSPIETVPYEGPVTGEPIAIAPVETPVPVSTPEVKMPSSEEITKSVTESVQGQTRA
ncbi:MAG: response regulator, partial [Thermodesulfovibrionales bacterium]